jgi:nicotinate-nucleotide adenylyltransferase
MAAVETDLIFELPASGVGRVGLLGGSFNPAHDGHRHISLEAHKSLQLDEVWWLVSPQNPLKEIDDMAPMATRLSEARHVAHSPHIRVTDIESKLDTLYTVDTVAALKSRFADTRFVWLMGADNLLQMPQWRDWETLFRSVPIAIFTRSSYSRKALAGVAAQQFSEFRIPERAATELVDRTPPAWVFLHISPHPASATRIRQKSAKKEKCDAN